MTWAATETQKAIYQVLIADATLMTALGSSVNGAQRVFDSVPDNQACPYITMKIKPVMERGNEDFNGLIIMVHIDVWYDKPGLGDLPVQTIQKRIDELLNNQNDIVITGWNIISNRREMSDILIDPDGRTKHGIQTFKLMLGE